MSVARHKRDPEIEGLSLEEIMQRYVGRFSEKKADWAAFWEGPEAQFFRSSAQSYYQVPLVYTWNDVVVEGAFTPTPAAAHTGAGGGDERGDVVA